MTPKATAMTIAVVVGGSTPSSMEMFRWVAASAGVLLMVGRVAVARGGTREVKALATLSGLPDLVEKRSLAPSRPQARVIETEFSRESTDRA